MCNYTYDTWGNVLTECDSVNSVISNTVTNEYDSWGNLIRTQIPGSGTVVYTNGWGSDGHHYVLKQGTARPWIKTWYDGLGREILIESIGPKDIEIKKRTTYNTKGQVSSVENTQGSLVTSTDYIYDNRGRVLSETANSGASVQYQYGNRTVTVTSGGRSKYTRYDALGNIKEVTDPVSTVNYFYSTNGQLRRVDTGNCIYEFGYDEIGNRISYSDPDAGTTTYTYDALGRETGHTDARNVHFTTSYDVFGRVTSETAGAEAITYTYGTSGTGQMRLVSKTLGAWSDTYEYDQYGRLTSQNVGGHATGYQYNSAGLLTRRIWNVGSEEGKYVDYTYDSYGNHISSNAISGAIIWNLTQNTGTTTASTMKLNSNPTLYTRTLTADSYGYPASYSLKRDTVPIGGETYTYNYSTGNLTQCVKEWHTETYSYDDADRFVTFNVDGSEAMSMTYSSNGNLLSKTGVGGYTYGSGTHKVVSVDNTDNVIPYSSQSITYNAWGKVAEVNETVGSDTYKYELTYGPDLQRVLAVLWKNNSLVHLVTYGDGYEEKYQNGNITRYYYVDGADGNSAVYTSHTQTGDKVYCIDRDHLGSVTALFDQNGNKCFSASFDPWGRRYVEQGSIEYDRGYTGHEHIDELGLIDMNGRMYDPILGRFISVDPYIQDPYNPQNFNRYAYCLNNPVKYTDPSGEIGVLAACLIAAGIDMAIDYGFQVIANLNAKNAEGQSLTAKEVFLTNIDWFDIGVSGVLGGVTCGAGLLAEGTTTMARVAKFINKYPTILNLSEIVLTSAIDITSNGFQKVSFGQFGQRVLTSLAISAADKAMQNTFSRLNNKKNDSGLSQTDEMFVDPLESEQFQMGMQKGAEMYPNKVGKTELHHPVPKYLGGSNNQELIRLDAAYHQLITNEFRKYIPYGYRNNPQYLDVNINDVMRKVYQKYPLPKLNK